jgi:hypothetical protein
MKRSNNGQGRTCVFTPTSIGCPGSPLSGFQFLQIFLSRDAQGFFLLGGGNRIALPYGIDAVVSFDGTEAWKNGKNQIVSLPFASKL